MFLAPAQARSNEGSRTPRGRPRHSVRCPARSPPTGAPSSPLPSPPCAPRGRRRRPGTGAGDWVEYANAALTSGGSGPESRNRAGPARAAYSAAAAPVPALPSRPAPQVSAAGSALPRLPAPYLTVPLSAVPRLCAPCGALLSAPGRSGERPWEPRRFSPLSAPRGVRSGLGSLRMLPPPPPADPPSARSASPAGRGNRWASAAGLRASGTGLEGVAPSPPRAPQRGEREVAMPPVEWTRLLPLGRGWRCGGSPVLKLRGCRRP